MMPKEPAFKDAPSGIYIDFATFPSAKTYAFKAARGLTKPSSWWAFIASFRQVNFPPFLHPAKLKALFDEANAKKP